LVYFSKHGRKLFEELEHEPTVKKAFAVVVGHRSATSQYSFPIEKIINGRRQFDFSIKSAETTEFEQRKDVWVTSGLPFLLYLFAGFIVMTIVGDLMIFIFAPFI
jgi:preflagellin peptidase FlaK